MKRGYFFKSITWQSQALCLSDVCPGSTQVKLVISPWNSLFLLRIPHQLRTSGYSQSSIEGSQSYLWLLSHPCNPIRIQVLWILPVNYLLSPFLFLHSHCSYSRSDRPYFSLKTNPATSELISMCLISLLSNPFSTYLYQTHLISSLSLHNIPR